MTVYSSSLTVGFPYRPMTLDLILDFPALHPTLLLNLPPFIFSFEFGISERDKGSSYLLN